MSHLPHDPNADPAHAELPRRGFFVRAAAVVIGLVVTVVPLATGLLFFLHPLVRKAKRPTGRPVTGADGYVKVTTLEALPSGGPPQRFTVYDDKQDAWNFFPHQQVGTVWLRRTDAGEIQCFNTRCPHLGCTVDYKSVEKTYFCPCHTSSFDLDGKKLNAIPPRGMDSLEVKVLDGNVLVKFENFRATTSEKIAVG